MKTVRKQIEEAKNRTRTLYDLQAAATAGAIAERSRTLEIIRSAAIAEEIKTKLVNEIISKGVRTVLGW